MSSTGQELHELLGLQSNVVETISYSEFLTRLRDRPEMADSAAATLVRAIESKGEVDIDSSPSELRPYLKMLKKMGVPTWKAFKNVRGSQRVVARLLNHLRAAAANGYQLRLAILLKGGPGSGKSFLANSIKDALEGEIVYAVDGCPVHENPINLLNLLSEETICKIESQLKMTDADRDAEFKAAVKAAKGSTEKPVRKPTLHDLLAISGQPCQHCWSAVMKGDKPNLSEIKVTAMRLSSRSFGISTWSKNCTLAQSLEMGSRGVVDMPELFGSAAAGKDANALASAEELDILLEATNDRQIPAGCGDSGSCGEKSSRKGFLPLDAVMIGQTNDGSYARFMQEQADPDKFMRRIAIFNVPYITSVSEEEQAYRAAIAEMRDQPHFDPMTLKITALLAVISRMKKDHAEVDIVKRARMYDGEQLAVEKKNINNAQPGSAANQASNPFGSNYGGRATTGTQAAPKKVTAYWSVGEFWAAAGEDEGMAGLNMPDMLNIISEAVSLVMRDAGPDDAPCISTLEMLGFLRTKIEQMKKKPGLTDTQKKVLENCTEFLRPPKDISDKPGLIEEEYRRVLKRQFLEVIAPDFERRAKELFERYRVHARAFAGGQKDAIEMVEQAGKLVERRVKVNFDGILDDLENNMGLYGESDKADFRRSVEGHILNLQLKARQATDEEGDEEDEDTAAAAKVDVTWRTLPKLAEGIAKKLNDESAKKLERVLKSEIELSEEDKTTKREALQRFKDLGYCEHCAKVALTYFNDYQLWKQS